MILAKMMAATGIKVSERLSDLFCEGLAIKMGLKKNVINLFLNHEGRGEDALRNEFNKHI